MRKSIGLIILLSGIVLTTVWLASSAFNTDSLAQNSKSIATGFFGRLPNKNAPDGTLSSVTRDKPIVLPKDHQSHPDYQLEWWYLTFVLADDNNNQYGLQYTLFRFNTPTSTSTPPNHWANSQQWMGHASLHTPSQHFFEERFAAGGVGNAFVNNAPFEAVIDNWAWVTSDKPSSTEYSLFPSSLNFTITSPEAQLQRLVSSNQEHVESPKISVYFSLNNYGPAIKQGDEGYSPKTQDERLRSYYYSYPFINAQGKIVIDDKAIKVSGLGWFDHEWTSHLANSEAMGWDWFSLHLDNGDKLMAFRMHAAKSKALTTMSDMFTTGSYITSDGRKYTLSSEHLSLLPLEKETITTSTGVREVPTSWRIVLNDTAMGLALDVNITPFKTNQWNNGTFSYYEGRVNVSGSHTGSGFLELTGY